MISVKYITNVRMPTARAQGYAIMKMCEKLSIAGVGIELIIPNRRSNEDISDPFDYYGIKNKFPIKKFKSFDLLGPFEVFGKIFYWIDMLSFLLSVRLNIKKFDEIFYTRDYLIALILPKNSLICLELHDIPSSKYFFVKAIKKIKLFVVLNKYIKNELVGLGVSDDNIIVSHSGVEVSEFDVETTLEYVRRELSLPLNKNIITYTGHFYEWKGVNTIGEVAKIMPENIFLLIGGVEPDLTRFKKKYGDLKNILILPFADRKLIPLYLKASNVLVLPNSAKEKISNNYTSPLKLFEYMASRRPIVAADLPSIREVLNENNCVFAKPDDPEDFKDRIYEVLNNPEHGKNIAEQAFQDVQQYSWENRAKQILEKIKCFQK